MKKRGLFLLCSFILLLNKFSLYASKVSLPSSQFAGDSADSGALLGSYKALADKAISIAFIIAAVPVLWLLATHSPRSKKALIGYIVSILAYYGVISKFV
jgi:hypothetical protein